MKKSSLLIFGLFIVITSCKKDDDTAVVVNVPATYSFERGGATTVSFSGQTTRINMATELIDAMKDFSVSEETMLEMYRNETVAGGDADPYTDADLNVSTKSVKSKVAASSDFFSANTAESAEIKADFEAWINAQVTEVFPNEQILATSGVAGQIADGSSARYVSGKGLEYNQAVNKGLIGALMLDQILNNYISTSVLDAGENVAQNDQGLVEDGSNYTTMEHKWDEAYGYLFGKSTNAADPLATLGEGSFLNKYLSRVENDADFTGIAQTVYDAFKLGRAAIVEGAYDVRDEQAEIIRKALSKVIAIRAVYYLQQGKNARIAGNNGTAFHDLSEGYGFVYSLRFTRQTNSSDTYFTGAEVDGYIADLMAGNGFWDVSTETLDNISEAIAAKFDFTVAQAAE